MKRICLAAAIAALLCMPAVAQTPSAEKLDLARRVLATTSTPMSQTLEKVLPGAVPKQDPWVAEAPDVFLAGLRKVLADNAPGFRRIVETRAKAYAEAFSEDELRAVLAYTESPLGKSFAEKKSAADGATSAAITPEEQAARDVYDNGPGKILEAKSKAALAATGSDAAFIALKIVAESRLEFCLRTTKCPANAQHDLQGMVDTLKKMP